MAGPIIRPRPAPPLRRRLVPSPLGRGGTVNPEASPIEPVVPGTRDTIDAPDRILRALERELFEVEDKISQTKETRRRSKGLASDQVRQRRLQGLLKLRDEILLRLFTQRT